MKLPGPKKPIRGTLLDNATSVDEGWYTPRPPDPEPLWQKWLNTPEIELWKAIALSCGREPPAYYPEGLDEEFDLRMAIAIAHITPAGALSNAVRNKRPHLSCVRLADIARLADLSVPPWILPHQFPSAVGAALGKVQPPQTTKFKAGAQRQRVQERRILELLSGQGYEASRLPPRVQGKRGTKAAIKRLALTEPAVFTDKSFELAWQRLRDAGEIAESSYPQERYPCV